MEAKHIVIILDCLESTHRYLVNRLETHRNNVLKEEKEKIEAAADYLLKIARGRSVDHSNYFKRDHKLF